MSRNSKPEVVKIARTHRNKAIRFDTYPDDEPPITWFAAYRGRYGWFASRKNGEQMDKPSDDAVEWAVEEGADEVELINLSDLPDGVTL